MPPPQKKSEENRSTRMPLLALSGWGLIAILSFVGAFMALQFSEFENSITVASNSDKSPEYTGSINSGTEPRVGIMKRGAATGRPSKTQELSTDVEILRRELIALRRTVSLIRESRDDLVIRLAAVEQKYGVSASARTKSGRNPARVIPSDPLPLTAATGQRDIPPIPPIPKAAPPSKKSASKTMRPEKTVSKRSEPKKSAGAVRKVDNPALTTASIPKRNEAEDTKKTTTEKTSFGVDLGGYSTLATLSKGWTNLKSDQKSLLEDLAPRAILSDKNGRLEVRLVAGPFSNAAHAITLCAQLQARGRSCQPSLFVGQPVVVQ